MVLQVLSGARWYSLHLHVASSPRTTRLYSPYGSSMMTDQREEFNVTALARTAHFARFCLAFLLGSALPVTPGFAQTHGAFVQTVSPGQSIQAAIDRAPLGGWIFVQPGTYQETADATNGLNITESVNLVGLSTATQKVVLKNAGGQKNGIVAVPAAHTKCMSCHSSMAPPFDLLPGVRRTVSTQPIIFGLSISGITIQDFDNNGLFTSNVKDFTIIDVHSVGNKDYGIFPTLSQNGVITDSSATGANDTGIWIETSQDVTATRNLVEGNVLGFEVSNSDRIQLTDNEVRGNSVGMGIFFLPDIFDERPDTTRITVRNNYIHDNNKADTSPLASLVPSSVGVLLLGADNSQISDNLIAGHDFVGIGVADYCLVAQGGPLDCTVDPHVSPGFLADNTASQNRVTGNELTSNGAHPDPTNPFAFAAGDIALLTSGPNGNCFAGNQFSTFFSSLGFLPPCPASSSFFLRGWYSPHLHVASSRGTTRLYSP